MRTMFCLLLAAVCTVFSQAQPPPPGGPQFERIERFKKMRMVEMLDLKEEQSIRFFARHNEFENVRRELNRQRDETLDKIERLIRNNADAKEYDKLFAEVEATNRKVGEEKLRFFNGLNDVLSIEQRAKLLLFERRFETELREAMREAQQRRRGRLDGN